MTSAVNEFRQRDGLLDQLRADISLRYRSRDYLLEVDDVGPTHETGAAACRIDDTLSLQAKVPAVENTAFRICARHRILLEVARSGAAMERCRAKEPGRRISEDVVIPRRTQIVQLARQATALLDLIGRAPPDVQAHFRRRDHHLDRRSASGRDSGRITIRRVQRLEEAPATWKWKGAPGTEAVGPVGYGAGGGAASLAGVHDEIGQAMSTMLVSWEGWKRSPSIATLDGTGCIRYAGWRSQRRHGPQYGFAAAASMLDDLGLIPARGERLAGLPQVSR
jgi:hypothetical protein